MDHEQNLKIVELLLGQQPGVGSELQFMPKIACTSIYIQNLKNVINPRSSFRLDCPRPDEAVYYALHEVYLHLLADVQSRRRTNVKNLTILIRRDEFSLRRSKRKHPNLICTLTQRNVFTFPMCVFV